MEFKIGHPGLPHVYIANSGTPAEAGPNDVYIENNLEVGGTIFGDFEITNTISTVLPLLGGGNLSDNLTLSIPVASGSADGYLSSSNWTTFNSKVGTTRTISTTAPLTGGGDLSANRTIAIPAATSSVDGYLTSVNWTTFNNKVATTRTISTTAPLTGGGDLSANRTFAMPAATSSVDGYLTSVNWTTFNNKVSTTRTISTTSPLGGGGDLSGDLSLYMPAADGATDGYLTSSDWNTFSSGLFSLAETNTNGVMFWNGSQPSTKSDFVYTAGGDQFLGLGTSSPGYKLHVEGDIYETGKFIIATAIDSETLVKIIAPAEYVTANVIEFHKDELRFYVNPEGSAIGLWDGANGNIKTITYSDGTCIVDGALQASAVYDQPPLTLFGFASAASNLITTYNNPGAVQSFTVGPDGSSVYWYDPANVSISPITLNDSTWSVTGDWNVNGQITGTLLYSTGILVSVGDASVGGKLQVGSGTGTAKAHVFTSTATDGITIENTNAGASGGLLNIFHNSASPAVSDATGIIQFTGKSSTGVTRTYAQIQQVINSATNAAEAGELVLSTMKAGTLTEAMRIDESGWVGIGNSAPGNMLTVGNTAFAYQAGFNGIDIANSNSSSILKVGQGSVNQLQFRWDYNATPSLAVANLVTYGYSNPLWIDASAVLMQANNSGGKVGIGTSPSNKLHVYTTTSADGISIDGNNAPALVLRSSGTIRGYSPAIVTGSGAFFTDSITNDLAYRSEGGKILYGVGAGASTMAIENGKVGVNKYAPSTSLHIATSTGADGITIENTNGGIYGSLLNFYHNSASPAASDLIGIVQFDGKSSTGVTRTYSQIISTIGSTTNGSESGELVFNAIKAGTLTESFRINSAGTFAMTAGTTTKAPLKFTSGTNLTTPVAGSMEFDGTNLYITQTSGPTRKQIITDFELTGEVIAAIITPTPFGVLHLNDAADAIQTSPDLIYDIDNKNLKLVTDNAGVTGPIFTIYHNSASPDTSDVTGAIKFDGKNSVGSTVTYGQVRQIINDPTDGLENGDLIFSVMATSTLRDKIFLYDGLMYDNSNYVAIDWTNRYLNDGVGTLSVDWNNRYLTNVSGNPTVDWQNHYMFDASGVNSIFWHDRYLKNASDQEVFNWSSLICRDTAGFDSVNWGVRYLLDTSGGTIAVDWSTRYLVNSSGGVVVAWNDSVLIDNSGFYSSDWQNRYLYDTSGSTLSVDWANRYLYDSGSYYSANWQSRYLYDGGAYYSVDWANRYLYDTSGTTASIDWANRLTYDSSSYASLDWQNRYLYDAGASPAIDYNNRYLQNNSTTITVNWESCDAYDSASVQSINWSNRVAYDATGTQAINWNSSTGIAIGNGTASSKLHVFTSTAADGITVENTNAGASGSVLNLYHNSASPAASDITGAILFRGKSSTGTVRTYAQIHQITNSSTNTAEAGELVFSTIKAGTLTEAMRIDESGNLGIGTNNPSYKVHTVGTSDVRYAVTNGTILTTLGCNTGGAAFLTTDTNHPIDFWTNSLHAMRLDTSRNLGIGLGSGVNPSARLHVKSGRLRLDQTDGTNGSAVIEFYNGSANMYWFMDAVANGNDGQIRTDSARYIILQSNETSSGGVGVGKRTPAAKLHVQPYVNTQIGTIIQAASSQSANIYEVQNSAGTILNYIDSSGNYYCGPVPSSTYYTVAPLNVNNSAGGTLKTQLNLINTGGGGGCGSAIDFYTYTNQVTSTGPGARYGAIDNGSYSAYHIWYTKTTGSPANAIVERMRLSDSALTTSVDIIPTSNNTLSVGTTANQFAYINSRFSYVYGAASNAYVQTWVPTNGASYAPEVDFIVGGTRKMVFGYDGLASRGIFYSDNLGQGMYFYDGSGIALGNDVSTFAGNQFLFSSASTSNTVIVKTAQAAAKVLTVRGASSQSGNLLELQNSSSTLLSTFDSGGRLGVLGSPYNTGTGLTVYKPASGIGIYTNGEIWCIDGGSQRFLFGSNTSTYSSFLWDSSSSKFHIAGNGNLGAAGASISLPFVSGQVSLVGINQVTPTATLDVTCNGSNTTKVMRVQSTQSSGDAVVEDTIQIKILTTNNSVTYGNVLTTATDYTYIVETTVYGKRTTGSGSAGDCCSFKLYGHFANISGTLTQKSTTLTTVIHQDDVSTLADYNVSGTTIRLAVTGVSSSNYTWHATSKISTVSI